MDTFLTLLELAVKLLELAGQIFKVLCDLFVLVVLLGFAWMIFG